MFRFVVASVLLAALLLAQPGLAQVLGPPAPSQLAVTAAGATVPRTLAARFADVVNVRDYGAKCDGTTDDTAAIRAAAAAVPATGGTIVFSGGICMIADATSLHSNTTVRGQGATIQNLPPASWRHGVNQAFSINGASNVTIEGMRFAYQHSVYNGGAAHIIEAIGSTNVTVRNNVSDGGGDFLASIGSNHVLSDGNVVTNVSNGCFDHWGGSADVRVVNNYCTTLSSAGTGVGAVQFTGIGNTDGGAAFNSGFYAAGNTIYINTTGGQAFEINGSASGGADDRLIITGNKIFITALAWGVLVTGNSNHGIIANNYIEATAPTVYGAVNVVSPATGWNVVGNIAYEVQAGSNGVFSNSGTGGLLANNLAYSSSTPLLGTAGTNVLTYGNDTGTGMLNLANVNITSGAAAFSASPTAPTPATADRSTKLATTAFVDSAITSATNTLRQASSSVLDGVTVSTGLSVSSGVLSVTYGTTSGTAAQGNDSRIAGAAALSGAAFTGAVSINNAFSATGNATIGWNGAGGIALIENGAVGTARGIVLETAGSYRWRIVASTMAESGSNVGSDLAINSYSDSGSTIGTPLTITRATGAVTLTGLVSVSAASGITAHPGGGQASATTLTAQVDQITTVATAADSVALPTAVDGLCITVINGATNSLQVYGVFPATINGLATGTGVAVAGGKIGRYCAISTSAWYGGTLN